MKNPTIKIAIAFIVMCCIPYLVFAQTQRKERRVGIIFSPQEYEYIKFKDGNKLVNVIPEGKKMYDLLNRKYDFDTLIFMENPLKSDYTKIISWLKHTYKITDEDHLFIMFNGHGAEGYLCFSDTKTDTGNPKKALIYPKLRSDMDLLGARHTLILLDVCKAGSAIGGPKPSLATKGIEYSEEDLIGREIESNYDPDGEIIYSNSLKPSLEYICTAPWDRNVTDGNLNYRLFYNALETNKSDYLSAKRMYRYIERHREDVGIRKNNTKKIDLLSLPKCLYREFLASGSEFGFVLKTNTPKTQPIIPQPKPILLANVAPNGSRIEVKLSNQLEQGGVLVAHIAVDSKYGDRYNRDILIDVYNQYHAQYDFSELSFYQKHSQNNKLKITLEWRVQGKDPVILGDYPLY
jgi:hypothetical protein